MGFAVHLRAAAALFAATVITGCASTSNYDDLSISPKGINSNASNEVFYASLQEKENGYVFKHIGTSTTGPAYRVRLTDWTFLGDKSAGVCMRNFIGLTSGNCGGEHGFNSSQLSLLSPLFFPFSAAIGTVTSVFGGDVLILPMYANSSFDQGKFLEAVNEAAGNEQFETRFAALHQEYAEFNAKVAGFGDRLEEKEERLQAEFNSKFQLNFQKRNEWRDLLPSKALWISKRAVDVETELTVSLADLNASKIDAYSGFETLDDFERAIQLAKPRLAEVERMIDAAKLAVSFDIPYKAREGLDSYIESIDLPRDFTWSGGNLAPKNAVVTFKDKATLQAMADGKQRAEKAKLARQERKLAEIREGVGRKMCTKGRLDWTGRYGSSEEMDATIVAFLEDYSAKGERVKLRIDNFSNPRNNTFYNRKGTNIYFSASKNGESVNQLFERGHVFWSEEDLWFFCS